MPYRSCITVFFPTPLIFRYHLPLRKFGNSLYSTPFTSGVKNYLSSHCSRTLVKSWLFIKMDFQLPCRQNSRIPPLVVQAMETCSIQNRMRRGSEVYASNCWTMWGVQIPVRLMNEDKWTGHNDNSLDSSQCTT